MKRKCMLAIAFVGMIFAGKIGLATVTGASSPVFNTPTTTTAEPVQIQRPLVFEFTEAELDRANKGLVISPVPINAGAGRTRVLIGLGSYIVNGTGGCVGCHTSPTFAPGGNPFNGQPLKFNTAAYLAGGARFGPITSRNLTPDPQRNNLPGGMTLETFIHVMRTGIDRDNLHPQISPLLQTMPWPAFGNMTDRDLQAIYLYLSVIPHADTPQ